MSSLFQVAALAGALGAAALVPASSAIARPAGVIARASSGPLACELHVAPAGGGAIVLSAVARAGAPAVGRYSLRLAKDGDATSADMQQDGTFAVGPGGASTLSEINMSLEPGASYSAVLTLTWGGGRITCRQAVTTRI